MLQHVNSKKKFLCSHCNLVRYLDSRSYVSSLKLQVLDIKYSIESTHLLKLCVIMIAVSKLKCHGRSGEEVNKIKQQVKSIDTS